jgi:hypothetical protein
VLASACPRLRLLRRRLLDRAHSSACCPSRHPQSTLPSLSTRIQPSGGWGHPYSLTPTRVRRLPPTHPPTHPHTLWQA